MNFRSITLALALGALCSQAWAAAPTPLQSHVTEDNTGNPLTTWGAQGSAITVGDTVIGQVVFNKNVSCAADFTNVTDGGTNTYAIIDTPLLITGSNTCVGTFGKVNVTAVSGTPTLTANFANAVLFPQIAWIEYSTPIATIDVHGQALQQAVSTTNNAVSSPLGVTTTVNGDLLIGLTATRNSNVPAVGTGFTQRLAYPPGSPDWVFSIEDKVQATASSNTVATFTAQATDDFITSMIALKVPPVPTGINCTPSTTITDTAAQNTTVCAFTVTMSDGSGYTGTTTANPATLVNLLSSTGNSTVRTQPNPMTSAFDGPQTFTMTAKQNGVTFGPASFTFNVSPASVAGTPLAMGWKSVDPNNQVVFTEPTSAKTVNQILLRNAVLLGSTGLLDVYKVPASTACTSGTKLTANSLDLNARQDLNQVAVLAGGGVTSLSIGDSICVLTRNGSGQPLTSPGSMQGTLTVTVN